MASDFDDETDGKGTLLEFDERIALSSASDESDGRGETVTMMTIHAAKGLEFPVVFLCGMEDGIFPSLRERDAQDDAAALEEERRLAYVAITRAMDRLILTNARTRRHWGEIRMNRPSRFLDAIPAECLAVRERPRVQSPSYTRPATSPGGRGAGYDEFDQRAYEDDVPSYQQDDGLGDEVREGSQVSHASFGIGRVVASSGAGKDQKLVIEFSSVGRKTILARFVVET